eukprot:c53748_g1_i1 orf=386-568(+)
MVVEEQLFLGPFSFVEHSFHILMHTIAAYLFNLSEELEWDTSFSYVIVESDIYCRAPNLH